MIKENAWEKLADCFGDKFQNVLPDKIWSLETVFKYQNQFNRLVGNAEKELEGNFLLIPDKKIREKYFLGKYRKIESQIEQNLHSIKQLHKEKPAKKFDKLIKELRIELLRQQNNSLFGFTLIKLNDIYSGIIIDKVRIDKGFEKNNKGKRKTTQGRYKLYLNRYRELTEKENLSSEKAVQQVCKQYEISPKTLYRAIKEVN